MRASECSGRTLAFLGDAAWSLVVRTYLVEKGYGRGNDLQKHSVHYVSAKAQSELYDLLHEASFFTEEEEDWYRKGRNANAGTVPKNTPVSIYRKSTGFEAILGALSLENNWNRIGTIWDKVITLKEEGLWHN